MLKKKNHKIARENKAMRGAIKEMTAFFEQVSGGSI
jgi:hypothetical protein